MIKLVSFFTIAALFFLSCSSSEDNNAQNNNAKTTPKLTTISNNSSSSLDVEKYDTLLQKYVDANGQVDYASLKADDELAILTLAAEVGNADVSSLSSQAKLAFYINAYNILVLSRVVKLYPIPSVMDVDGFFDQQMIKVAGKMMTLNTFEEEYIRVPFAEPRIHFALVCAAKSCPPLLGRSYRDTTLEATLEANTKAFITNSSTVNGNTVTVSPIFDWYQKDFRVQGNTVEKFLANYLPEHKTLLESNDVTLDYSEYNWALNAQ